MRHAKYILFALFLAVESSTIAVAQDDEEYLVKHDVADLVWGLAFDPRTYFTGNARDPVISISSRDAYNRPLYSVAFVVGCLDRSEERGEADECRRNVTARMARVPTSPDPEASFDYGRYLVDQLISRRSTTRNQIRDRLSGLGVKWLEADVRSCDGAVEVLSSAAELDWVSPRFSEELLQEDENRIFLISDANMVEVVFDGLDRTSTYHGNAAEGSPGAWAGHLYEVLEPCWRPNRYRPPWEQ